MQASILQAANKQVQVYADGELFHECKALDDALTVTRMIMDAKLEGFALIKKQLQSENADLQSQMNKFSASTQMEHTVRANNEALFEKEKKQIQSSMKQLQGMYEQQKKDLQQEIVQHKKQYEFLQSQYDECKGQVQSLHAELHAMEQVKEIAERRISEQEHARSKLAAEHKLLQHEYEARAHELELVKSNQKYFRLGQYDGKLPTEKIDLVKTGA